MKMPSSNSQKVLKGISSQTIVTLVLGIVEIGSFSIMSRLLTKEDFGYYAAITAIAAVFSALSETGIGSAIVQRKDLTKKYIDNAFTLSLIIGFILMFALILCSGPMARAVVDEKLQIPLMLVSVTLLMHCLSSVNLSLMQRKLQFFRMGLINLISLVLTTVVAVILALRGLGFYAILTKAVLTSFLTLVISYFLACTKFRLAFDIVTIKAIFSFSGWGMLGVLFRNFAQQADKLLMSQLLSVAALGSYNRPKEFISQISSKLNGIFDSALFPVLSTVQDNKQSLGNAYKKSLYYMNLFSLVLCSLFVFNATFIVRIFFGEEWLSLVPVFQVLSIALIFNVDGRLADCYLRSLALTKQQFYFRVFETVMKIIGLVIGARYELMGVAWSVLITDFIMICLKMAYIAGKIDVPCLVALRMVLKAWRMAIFCVPIFVCVNYCMPNTWLGNVIFAMLFVIILFLFFVFFPNVIGSMYKENVYPRILCKFKQLNPFEPRK